MKFCFFNFHKCGENHFCEFWDFPQYGIEIYIHIFCGIEISIFLLNWDFHFFLFGIEVSNFLWYWISTFSLNSVELILPYFPQITYLHMWKSLFDNFHVLNQFQFSNWISNFQKQMTSILRLELDNLCVYVLALLFMQKTLRILRCIFREYLSVFCLCILEL